MFDIGFFELLLIGVVALVVIGPEQLPETLRTLALWWGRLKRGVQSTRTELEEHIGADDIRRQLHNEDIMRQLATAKKDIETSVNTNLTDLTQPSSPISSPEKDTNSNSDSNSDNSKPS